MSTNTYGMNQIVAEFEQHDQASEAIKELGKAHLNVDNLTIIGQDYHTEEQPTGFINTGERMMSWGKYGAFWGSIWGILFGSAVIFVPGIGTVLFGGWIVATLVAAIDGAVIGGGLAALGGALASVGIPQDSVVRYQSAIKAGKFLVIVRGTPEEIELAKSVLTPLGAKGLEVSEHRTLVAV